MRNCRQCYTSRREPHGRLLCMRNRNLQLSHTEASPHTLTRGRPRTGRTERGSCNSCRSKKSQHRVELLKTRNSQRVPHRLLSRPGGLPHVAHGTRVAVCHVAVQSTTPRVTANVEPRLQGEDAGHMKAGANCFDIDGPSAADCASLTLFHGTFPPVCTATTAILLES